MRKIIKNKTLWGAIIVLFLWYVLSLSISTNLVPNPYDTMINFIKIFPDKLIFHIIASGKRIVGALVIALGVGVTIGLWLGLNEKANEVLNPVVYALYPIPKVAFLPIFMIIFGLGDLAKIMFIATVIIFQIIVTTRDAAKDMPKELVLSVKSLGLSKYEVYTNLVIPYILPNLFSTLRITIGMTMAALFFGENFATTYGLGYFVMNSWSMVSYLDMFSGIVALSIMGVLLFKLIDLGERKLCPWMILNKE